MTAWLWMALTAVAFAAGFWLSWRRFRRGLQARVDEAAADEVRRQIESRVLAELRRGDGRRNRNDTGERE